MIKFDRNGNPSPPGIIKITSDDFKKIFVEDFSGSESRPTIYDSYSTYCSDFKNQISQKFDQWLNGSYTTTKLNPNDIDLINIVLVDDELNSKGEILRSFLSVGGSKDKYLVDGYFIPVYDKADPRREITEHWLSHWADFFGHDRMRRPKALIEVPIN